MKFIDKILSYLFYRAENYRIYKRNERLKKLGINGSLIASDVALLNFNNIKIGKTTYINGRSMIYGGKIAKVTIGDYCAIGYNVHIKASTHDLKCPTGENMLEYEADIVIGDNVWIGDNVFIKEGVTLGSNVIVGANSVVTKSFGDKVVLAGCPAKIIKKINS